jgi:hypothetical protein
VPNVHPVTLPMAADVLARERNGEVAGIGRPHFGAGADSRDRMAIAPEPVPTSAIRSGLLPAAGTGCTL